MKRLSTSLNVIACSIALLAGAVLPAQAAEASTRSAVSVSQEALAESNTISPQAKEKQFNKECAKIHKAFPFRPFREVFGGGMICGGGKTPDAQGNTVIAAVVGDRMTNNLKVGVAYGHSSDQLKRLATVGDKPAVDATSRLYTQLSCEESISFWYVSGKVKRLVGSFYYCG